MEGQPEELVSVGEATPQETKPKRQLSEAQLAQLAKAREKANAVRKRNAEQRQSQKQKEQQLQDLKRQAHQQEVEAELTKYRKPRAAEPAKPRKQAVVELESESSSEEESSSSSEEEPIPKRRSSKRSAFARPRKRTKRKPLKQRRRPQVSESESSSSDEDYVPNTQVTKRQQVQDDMYDRQMQRAFASLFPNSYV